MAEEIQVPDFGPLVKSLGACWDKVPLRWVDFVPQLPLPLQAELSTYILDDPEELDSVAIYTDGSFNGSCPSHLAAWSFVVFGACQQEMYVIIDYDWGLVTTDPMDSDWTGADKSNAKTAEVAALIRAVEWLFASRVPRQVSLCYGSLLAGGSGSGEYGIHVADRQLRLLRSLVCAYVAYAKAKSQLIWTHVKGHSGILGNELADFFAKHAFSQQEALRQKRRPDYSPYVFGRRYPIELFWMVFHPLSADERLIRKTTLQLPQVDIGGTAEQRLPSELLDTTARPSQLRGLNLFLATYNVLTLGPKAGVIFVQYLRDQASSHALDVLFLQETRAKKDQLVISATHYRYVAAATEGHGGVEIWLARGHEGCARPIFSKERTQVLHAESQVLVIKTVCKGIDLLLLTFHAPHSGRAKHDILAFWTRLTEIVVPFFRKYSNRIFGADCNAHFAEGLPEHIGDAGLEGTTDVGGDCLRKFVLDLDLFLPSTVEHIHRGDHRTWWSFSNNKGARCDYFAVPKSWQSGFFETQVRSTLDEGNASIDHLPVTMHCKIFLLGHPAKRAKMPLNRKALQGASPARLQEIVSDVVVPDWSSGIDQHALQLTSQISERLCAAFPMERGPRRSYISEDSWRLRSERVSIRRQLVKAKSSLEGLRIFICLRCWRWQERVESGEFLVRGMRLYSQDQAATTRDGYSDQAATSSTPTRPDCVARAVG